MGINNIRHIRPIITPQLQREVRISQLIRTYPTEETRKELKELLKRLDVSEAGTGQLIAHYSSFGLCMLDWQGPHEEFIIDNIE